MSGQRLITGLPSQVSFIILFAISLIVGWRSLAATLVLAWSDDQYTHILLILPIFGLLIYLDKRAVRSPSVPCLHAGVGLLLSSLLVTGCVKWWCSDSLPSDA